MFTKYVLNMYGKYCIVITMVIIIIIIINYKSTLKNGAKKYAS